MKKVIIKLKDKIKAFKEGFIDEYIITLKELKRENKRLKTLLEEEIKEKQQAFDEYNAQRSEIRTLKLANQRLVKDNDKKILEILKYKDKIKFYEMKGR